MVVGGKLSSWLLSGRARMKVDGVVYGGKKATPEGGGFFSLYYIFLRNILNFKGCLEMK